MHDDRLDIPLSQLWQHARRAGMARRRFLYLLSVGGAAAVLAACNEVTVSGEQPDCIVVGSGPVGTAAALRLAENGIRVLILERGPSITEPNGTHFRNQPRFEADPDSYFAAIDPYLMAFVNPPSDVLPGLADSSLRGGQGVIWTNNCLRASDFERWDAMSPEEWERRYAEAEKRLQVTAEPSPDSRTGSHVRARLAEVLESPRSVRDLPFSGRVHSDGSVYFNAPYDMLSAAPSRVTDNIAIRDGVEVARIAYEGDRVTGVDTVGPGGEAHIGTKALLLAGGAVGTPQLLQRSGIVSPELGRGFSFHALMFGQIVLDAQLSSPARESDLPPRLWIPPTPDAPWHIQVLRDTFPVPATEAVENPHRLLEFQAFLPIEYRDANRFIFSDGGQVTVEFSFSSSDEMRMQAMETDVCGLAGHLGRWRGGGGEIAFVPHGTAHLVGSCRMAFQESAGVADRNGKVHGFGNLYLASVGLIPSPVAVNPTLTAVALAMRTAEDLILQL